MRQRPPARLRSTLASDSVTSSTPSTLSRGPWAWHSAEQPGWFWIGLMMPSTRCPSAAANTRERASVEGRSSGRPEAWQT